MSLYLKILPPAQAVIWDELDCIPKEFILYGGTAIALQLGHRESIDFDFFGCKSFDPFELLASLPILNTAKVLQSQPNTLTVSVKRGDGIIKMSFFGLPNFPRIAKVLVADNGLQLASLIDLAGTKVSVVQVRAELKDYLDIDAILESKSMDLLTALGAGKVLYGDRFNPQSTLKALCYFQDGNVHLLPEDIRSRLVKAASSVDLNKIPILPFYAQSVE